VALFKFVSGPFFCGGFEPSETKVSNFEQTGTPKERMWHWDVGAREGAHVDNRSVLAIR